MAIELWTVKISDTVIWSLFLGRDKKTAQADIGRNLFLTDVFNPPFYRACSCTEDIYA